MDFPVQALYAPLKLLWKEAWHWLPLVAALAMIAELPEIFLRFYLPDTFTLITAVMDLGTKAILEGGLALTLIFAMKLLIELLALMFAFVILADLTAGRRPDLGSAMVRLASWKLQGVWLLAGVFEQVAISMWYMGGTALMVPMGMVTTAAYEEESGMAAFRRSYDLGMNEQDGSRPGVRIGVGTALGFLIGFIASSAVSLVSMAGTLVTLGPDFWALLQGQMPDSLAAQMHYSWADVLLDLVLAPFGMLPTVYMMTLQQMTYWEARTWAEQRALSEKP